MKDRAPAFSRRKVRGQGEHQAALAAAQVGVETQLDQVAILLHRSDGNRAGSIAGRNNVDMGLVGDYRRDLCQWSEIE
jgi:hypothetical protein